MTVRSIAAAGAAGYAEYLDGKTVAPGRGDYYLGRDGEPVESPGRWLAQPETLAALGIAPGQAVKRDDLVALMQGRRPSSDEFVRRASSTGVRNAGVDVTLSAPKSVSVAWALGDPEQRVVIERLHHEAVDRAVAYLRDTVPLTQRWDGTRAVPRVANDVLAAAFLHSTARGLAEREPDPQLHTHVLVTSVVRDDGSVAAVRDRAMYRAAREGGAYYRAALAEGLARAGYEVSTGTGKKGRYFELAGVTPAAVDAFSGRAKEIERAVREFEARHGRLPVENELQHLKLSSRASKQPHTTRELTEAWRRTAAEHAQRPLGPAPRPKPFGNRDAGWGTRVERELTGERATFGQREARATALEQAAGRLAPETALAHIHQLTREGVLIGLDNGRLTTQEIRGRELQLLATVRDLAAPGDADRAVSPSLVNAAILQASEHVGAPLTHEQQHAVQVLTGSEHIAALEGQAGTGKSAVIDATARVERMSGRRPIGVALAGATAQRLGQDSPALSGRTTTIASLLSRHDRAGNALDSATTVILDEAGMVDTRTLSRLVDVIKDSGAKLIAVGDGRQLPAIGPGGMFDRLAHQAPRAELTTVHRTRDEDAQRAWKALRNGDPETALAHYLARDQLHLTTDRPHALQAAAARYDTLAVEHGHENVALISDGNTDEIDRLNARVQQLRAQRGNLGSAKVTIPGDDAPHYSLRQGDLVTWRMTQTVRGEARIENGTRGTIVRANPRAASVQVRVVGSGRLVTVTGPTALSGLRLGYAQHVVRQQGATVARTVAVTGGWQTSRENAYVQASRARDGIDWHIARDELGDDGTDLERLQQLAERMRQSQAKTPSVDHETAGGDGGPMIMDRIDPLVPLDPPSFGPDVLAPSIDR